MRVLEFVLDVSEDKRTVELVTVINMWFHYIVCIIMYVIYAK